MSRCRIALSVAALIVAAACGGEPPSEAPAADPSRIQAPRAEWILPVEGLEWRRTRLLAVFAFPLDKDPASLRIEANGRDVTERFLPVGLFSRRWSERTARADAVDPDAAEASGGFLRRAQAVLERGDLVGGRNVLTASFRDAAGNLERHSRRFEVHYTGRRIVCRVLRDEQPSAGARLVVEPLDGAAVPDLGVGSSHPLHPWPEPRRRSFVLARSGRADFLLPAGRYRIIATGGPLDGIDAWEVPAEGGAEHTFDLRREVRLPGTTTVDFHVHASPSLDSLVPLEERVHSFLAAGVDVIVASDHSDVTDYGPVIARLPGAAGKLTAIPGVEVSLRRPSAGASYGHWNVWPLPPDPEAPPVRLGQVSAHGALPAPVLSSTEDVRHGRVVAQMYDGYRQQGRALTRRVRERLGGEWPDDRIVDPVVVQLNHPRGIQHNPAKTGISKVHDWFNRAGFEPGVDPPARLLEASAAGTTALDFDVLEIWNRSSRRLYRLVRRDWFSLLNEGRAPAAAANTDTHTIAPELAGYPLNIVFLPDGQAGGPGVPWRDLAGAVRAGRSVGTDGPVPLLTVGAGEQSARPGELLAAPGGRVRIDVRALAASWVPVGEIRVWANGDLVGRGGDDCPQAARCLTLERRLERDAWIVAEVGDLDGVAEDAVVDGVYGRLVPRGLALGFTNPVRIDVDGNGRFDPPGHTHGRLPPAD